MVDEKRMTLVGDSIWLGSVRHCEMGDKNKIKSVKKPSLIPKASGVK